MAGRQPAADTLGVIEIELMKLVRYLETFGRRSSLYDRVDRAGYLALRTLDRLGPATPGDVADTLHLDSSTVTRQLAALRRAGLVTREPAPGDRRSATLALTGEGRKVMRRVEAARRRHIERLARGWSDAECRWMARCLALLNESLVEAVLAPLDRSARRPGAGRRPGPTAADARLRARPLLATRGGIE